MDCLDAQPSWNTMLTKGTRLSGISDYALTASLMAMGSKATRPSIPVEFAVADIIHCYIETEQALSPHQPPFPWE